jgi:hypothetical protein
VQQVDGALIVAQPAARATLDRRGQRRALAFVAEVGEDGVGLVGPLGQQRQHLRVRAARRCGCPAAVGWQRAA